MTLLLASLQDSKTSTSFSLKRVACPIAGPDSDDESESSFPMCQHHQVIQGNLKRQAGTSTRVTLEIRKAQDHTEVAILTTAPWSSCFSFTCEDLADIHRRDSKTGALLMTFPMGIFASLQQHQPYWEEENRSHRISA